MYFQDPSKITCCKRAQQLWKPALSFTYICRDICISNWDLGELTSWLQTPDRCCGRGWELPRLPLAGQSPAHPTHTWPCSTVQPSNVHSMLADMSWLALSGAAPLVCFHLPAALVFAITAYCEGKLTFRALVCKKKHPLPEDSALLQIHWPLYPIK